MNSIKKRESKIGFEVRCQSCKFFELWGMEQAIRALIKAGKLSITTDYDREIFAELLLTHQAKLICPQCRAKGTLDVKRAKTGQWDWEDAVYCEDCDKEIPPARIVAVPGVKRCISCQQKQDQYEN